MKSHRNQNMHPDKLQSETISFLRFPLIVGVLFVHNSVSNLKVQGQTLIDTSHGMTLFNTIQELFSHILTNCCVPLFFFISGFLFFLNTHFTGDVYKKKMISRAETLLIPYIFWNFTALAGFFIAEKYFGLGQFVSGNFKNVGSYNWIDVLRSFWDIRLDFPIAMQFWFIRDLMVTILLTPFIYLFIRYTRFYGIILAGVLWYFNIWMDIPGLSIFSLFFFSAGAYFSINKLNLIEQFGKLSKPAFIFYVILVLVNLNTTNENLWHFCYHFEATTGVIVAFNLSAYLLKNKKVHTNEFLSNASFFIFAVHMPILSQAGKLLYYFIRPQSEAMLILMYFLYPVIIILLSLAIYAGLKRYLPNFTKLITGGR